MKMSKQGVNNYICGTCKHYDSYINYCPLQGTVYEEDTCDEWTDDNEPTKEESEAQKVDAAERENHRKEVEGDVV